MKRVAMIIVWMLVGFLTATAVYTFAFAFAGPPGTVVSIPPAIVIIGLIVFPICPLTFLILGMRGKLPGTQK